VNVWCGLLYDRVIGPFCSDSTITGVVFLDLLEQYAFPQIETFKQETVNRVYCKMELLAISASL